MQLLEQCRYSELCDYISSFVKNNDVSENDIAPNLLDLAQSLSDLESQCEVVTDNVENKTIVYYPEVKDIDSKINVVPFLETSQWGISMEYKIGFRKNGWLFFDKISLASNNLDTKDTTFKSYDVIRDALSGSTIQEYVYSAINVATFAEDEGAMVRFTNSETRETLDHTLTDSEITAISVLSQVKDLHSRFYYSVDSWENM